MFVAVNNTDDVAHTYDDQGLVARSLVGLIFHAANRHASANGGRFYLGQS